MRSRGANNPFLSRDGNNYLTSMSRTSLTVQTVQCTVCKSGNGIFVTR